MIKRWRKGKTSGVFDGLWKAYVEEREGAKLSKNI